MMVEHALQRKMHGDTGSPDRRNGELPKEWAALVIIILLGVALRLFRLGGDSIWYDEGVSLYLANLSIPSLIAHTAGDIHPPLYYILLHLWLTAVGNSQFAAAFFSLFFGILLIPATFLVARRLLGRDVALLAALLITFSPYQLWYSQEIRMYTLGALLGLLSFHFMLGSTTESSHFISWPGYIICSALGLYTLYYFSFLLLFENLAVVALWLRRRSANGPNIKAWIAAQVSVVVLYLPWLPVAVRQATQPPVPPWRSFTSLGTVLAESWAALSLGQSVTVGTVVPVLLLIGVVYAVGAFWKEGGRPASLLLLGYTFVPVLVIYLVSLYTPLYHVRYVFLYAPAFSIVLARGLALLQRSARTLGALVFIIIVFYSLRSAQAYFYDSAYAPDDHLAAVTYIEKNVRPGDAVLINAGYVYPTFLYYYKGDIAWRGRLVDYALQSVPSKPGLVVLQTGSIGGRASLGWGSPTSDFYATTEAETAAALDAVAQRHDRIWVLRIYDTVTDPQGFIRRYLDDRFLLLDDVGFAGTSSLRVQEYRTYRTPRTTAPTLQHTVQADLGHQIRLLGYNLDGQLAPAQAAYLTVAWQAAGVNQDLRAFISLVDGSGQEWAHWDDVPSGRLYPTSRWAANEVIVQTWRLDVPAGTPPGNYRLEAGLYNAKSGSRLDVYNDTERSTGTVVPLGHVQVARSAIKNDAKSLPMQERIGAILGGEVRLLGYNLPSRLAAPGESIAVSVFWQGIKAADGGRVVFVQLLDRSGKVWAAWEGPPVIAWEAGDVLRDQYLLLVPADVPDGEMRLTIGIYRTEDRQRLSVKRGLFGMLAGQADSIGLGMVRVAGREHSYSLPPMQHVVNAEFGDGAQLLGFDMATGGNAWPIGPGTNLSLTLYWQGRVPMSTSYTVFVQLLDANNRLGGQHDALPGNGLLPTTSWLKDEVLTDQHQIAVRPDALPGQYRLVVGLYDAASGARVPVSVGGVRQPDDMLVLDTLSVK